MRHALKVVADNIVVCLGCQCMDSPSKKGSLEFRHLSLQVLRQARRDLDYADAEPTGYRMARDHKARASSGAGATGSSVCLS